MLLNRPSAAPAFVAAHNSRQVYVTSWQQTRAAALEDIATIQTILLTVSVLLIVLTVTAVSVLVATRISERRRQIATLKTVGVTPIQFSAMLLLEHGAVATVAVIVGVIVGPRLAVVLARPSGGLLAAAGTPAFSPGDMRVVAAAGYAIIVLACLRGSYAAARTSAIAGLRDGPHQPRRRDPRSRRASAFPNLPLVLRLGTRSLFRRRSRTLLAIISLALAVALGVAALATQRTFEVQVGQPGPIAGNTGAALQAIADRSAAARIRTLVDLFAVIFAIIAVVNLLVAAVFAARDSAPSHAVLRAIGFTPTQTGATLVSGQTVAGLIACLIGVPVGIGIFRGVYAATNKSALPAGNPPLQWLAGLVVAALLLTALLAAITAQGSSRRPITANLTTD